GRGWLGGAGKGVRGVAVRLSVARMEAGTVKASAMSALGAKAAGGLPEAAALARAGARVITVRTLPWSLESR
ncbi:MAG: hypothetical protein KDA20_01095, partial [Phycisphaerales bacterium]|nr:hypothetical protein [Phycisphaerales bacterium]